MALAKALAMESIWLTSSTIAIANGNARRKGSKLGNAVRAIATERQNRRPSDVHPQVHGDGPC